MRVVHETILPGENGPVHVQVDDEGDVWISEGDSRQIVESVLLDHEQAVALYFLLQRHGVVKPEKSQRQQEQADYGIFI